jgi:hypothetical protein
VINGENAPVGSETPHQIVLVTIGVHGIDRALPRTTKTDRTAAKLILYLDTLKPGVRRCIIP